MSRRIITGLIAGALLGVVCIVGASIRSSEPLSTTYLIAFWYNRVMIGLAIGLLPKSTLKPLVIKGIVIGLFVSFSFYIATNYQDLMGFLVGIVYGAIIGYAIYYFDNVKANNQS
jgi:hypothetical protein